MTDIKIIDTASIGRDLIKVGRAYIETSQDDESLRALIVFLDEKSTEALGLLLGQHQ
jgi:hypothetical protein